MGLALSFVKASCLTESGEDIFTNRCLEEIGVRKEDLTEVG